MKEKILLSIAQFEDIYSEWDDFKLKLVGNGSHIAVYDRKLGDSSPYDISDAKELLTDFKGVLKKNNLMISSHGKTTAKISPYTYVFETEFEELADRLERTLGNRITRLYIYRGKNGNPHVKFEYASNITSGEKQQIRKLVEQSVIEHTQNQSKYEEE